MSLNENTISKLSSLLADHRFYSGNEIAEALNISNRATVNNYIKRLKALGADIHSVKGKGYLLSSNQWLLDSIDLENRFKSIGFESHLVVSLESTNSFAKQRSNNQSPLVVASDHQTGGRGRFGRVWQSPFGKNLYATLALPIQALGRDLSNITLVVGVSLATVLNKYNDSLGLKWPNDLVTSDLNKAGGILTEFIGDLSGSGTLYIGFGINAGMEDDANIACDMGWANAVEFPSKISKSDLLFELIKVLKLNVETYIAHGFSEFKNRWDALDNLRDKTIKVINGAIETRGAYSGIDEKGALLLATEKGVVSYVGGEVSVRW